MLQVRQDICVGCGLCRENCPHEAVLLHSGKAHINQMKCNHCGVCLDICPRGAIVEFTPVSTEDLAITVSSLSQKTDDLIERIEKLIQKRRDGKGSEKD